LQESSPDISPSQIYAYAALMSHVPFANGAPNLSVDLPCMRELSARENVPIAGKDFKTGQTWLKTLLAPGLKARMLGLRGWYSTNILGNRDGEVLDDPDNFKTKEVSKLGVIDSVLQPEVYPELYGNVDHVVRINYYPPRGDNKEGWDNIDLFGWLGYPMQMKINFLCKDSILAAPIVLYVAVTRAHVSSGGPHLRSVVDVDLQRLKARSPRGLARKQRRGCGSPALARAAAEQHHGVGALRKETLDDREADALVAASNEHMLHGTALQARARGAIGRRATRNEERGHVRRYAPGEPLLLSRAKLRRCPARMTCFTSTEVVHVRFRRV
jgi:hypothetical protein